MGLVLSVERRGLRPQPGFVVSSIVSSVANLVDKARAFLHLRVFGVGKVWLGDLRLEEYEGGMPVQPPPRLGNMLQNSSFELGMDGVWYRDNSKLTHEGPRNPGQAVIDDTTAASGRRSLRLEGNGLYSSSYYPVAYQQHYTFSFFGPAQSAKSHCRPTSRTTAWTSTIRLR